MRTAFYLILLTLSLSACCKAYCIKDPQVNVIFQRFKAMDTDTIYVLRYHGGSAQQSDSTAYIRSQDSQDTSFSRVNLVLTPGYDWKIKVASLNRQFSITDIQTATGDCQCSSGNYHVVRSFLVNGQQMQGSAYLAE
ncbi:MAG TPA: hypothetical protein VGB46_00730 [Flavisolibacter sp.]|jgi:hypothetical protein